MSGMLYRRVGALGATLLCAGAAAARQAEECVFVGNDVVDAKVIPYLASKQVRMRGG